MVTTPHYRVSALNRLTEATGEIGVAWEKENGSIGLKLNPFVVLKDIENLVITLFPIEGGGQPSKRSKRIRNTNGGYGFRCGFCGCTNTEMELPGCPNPECSSHVITKGCKCLKCNPQPAF